MAEPVLTPPVETPPPRPAAPRTNLHVAIARVKALLPWLHAPLRNFVCDDGQVYAAGIAFYALVSLVPLCAVIVSLGGFVLARVGGGEAGTEDLITDLISALRRFIPFVDEGEARATLRSLVARRGNIGLIGLIGLTAAASQVIHALSRSVAKPFGYVQASLSVVDKPTLRTRALNVWRFVRRWIKAYLAIGFLGCMLALARFVLAIVASLSRHAPNAMLDFIKHPVVSFFVSTAGGLLVAFCGYVVLVWFLGRKATTWRGRIAGGLVFALMQTFAELAYAYYLAKAPDMTLTYGSLAGLIAVALWIYYSACVFLLSAEVTAVISNPSRLHLATPSPAFGDEEN